MNNDNEIRMTVCSERVIRIFMIKGADYMEPSPCGQGTFAYRIIIGLVYSWYIL